MTRVKGAQEVVLPQEAEVDQTSLEVVPAYWVPLSSDENVTIFLSCHSLKSMIGSSCPILTASCHLNVTHYLNVTIPFIKMLNDKYLIRI